MKELRSIPHPSSRISNLISRIIFPSTLFLTLVAAPAAAHELRPAYLELRETTSGEFAVLWKTPMRGEMRLALSVEFSGQTESLGRIATREAGGAAIQTWRVKALNHLRGQTIRIRGLESTMTDALVRMEFVDGTTWTQRLTPQQPAAMIPGRQSWIAVAGMYLKLGTEHILLGIDHLLFVLALLLITMRDSRFGIRDARCSSRISNPASGLRFSNHASRISHLIPLVKTITAFTISHSITLALATLGFVQVPQAPVEAVIALSIVFVAAEIREKCRFGIRDAGYGMRDMGYGKRDVRDEMSIPHLESLTFRKPWLVAFTFGLLHGFGFAGALNEVGLPQGQIPVALLFFNLGVEVGQLLFVASVLLLSWGVRHMVNTIRDTGYGMRDTRAGIRDTRYEPTSRIPDPVSRIVNRVSRIPDHASHIEIVSAYAIGSVAMFWVIQRVAAF